MASHRTVKAAKKVASSLNVNTMNRGMVVMDPNMKSKVYHRYMQHAEEMKRGVPKPFKELLNANMGDAQGYGQPPMTLMRQMLSLCVYPQISEIIHIPEDVEHRVKCVRAELPPGSLETDMQGLLCVRKQVAEYIRERDDGGDVRPEDIFLNDFYGCSHVLLGMIADNRDGLPAGVLVPAPSFPMYTALVAKNHMQPVYYYLHEDCGWEPNVKEMRELVKTARATCRPRAVLVINPGNPAGQVLSRETLEDIMGLCLDEGMILIADEVYQQNVYGTGNPFHSMKKIKHRLGGLYDNVQIASIHSTSKGFVCECGLRGGYAEFDGFDEKFTSQFLKTISLFGPPNFAGQIAISVCVKPPVKGDPSYETFTRERTAIHEKLSLRASLLSNRLGAIDGISVTPVYAGFFAYGTIENMPKNAVDKAEQLNMDASTLWALELLDETGVAVVPGMGFKQMPFKYHFRITIAQSVEVLEKLVQAITNFHKNFLQAYK